MTEQEKPDYTDTHGAPLPDDFVVAVVTSAEGVRSTMLANGDVVPEASARG